MDQVKIGWVMDEKIEQKIEELARLTFDLDEADVSALMAFVAEMKIFEAMLSDVLPTRPDLEDFKQIVSGTIEFTVNQMNANTDLHLVYKNLSNCISNLQEIFIKKKDPASLSFPFVIKTKKQEVKDENIELDQGLIGEFIEKLKADTTELESLILKIESDVEQDARISDVKRLIHTIKGEAGVLNLMDIQLLLHETESYIEKGKKENLVDKLLQVNDWLIQKVSAMSGESEDELEPSSTFIQKLFQDDEEKVFSQNKETPQFMVWDDPLPNEDEEKKSEKDIQQEEKEMPQFMVWDDAPVEEKAELKETVPDNTDYSYQADKSRKVSLDDEEFIHEFLGEAREHLDNVDQAVLTLEQSPRDKDAINMVFRAYHTIKGIAGMLDFEDVKNTAHAAENILDLARQDRLSVTSSVIDLIFESTDKLRDYVEKIGSALEGGGIFYRDANVQPLIYKIKNFLAKNEGESVEKEDVTPDQKAEQLSTNASVAQTATQPEIKPTEKVEQAQEVKEEQKYKATEAQKQEPKSKGKPAFKVKELIKVDTEVLDKILNTIGELVIAESMVYRNFFQGEIDSEVAERNLRQLEKITRELQELGMSLRMTSLKTTFEKMARLVRDVAKKTGKLVSFVMEGENTELDRNVVERISDPLIHMIRNAVDHGIESSVEDRVKSGKKPSGKITLRAYHEGGNVHIQIQDDGKGLDKEVIFQKAVDKGLISADQKISDEETYGLIFMPGFSTAQKITDVSGRGVGMDVVKKNIEALRGRVVIQSQKGKGSTFTIMLPLTLAIIDGMIIKVGSEKFIVPTLNIKESVKLNPKQFNYAMGKGESVLIRNQLIPVYHLSDVFHIQNGASKEELDSILMVVVENDGKQIGLIVDEIVGQQQIVIKNLGALFENLKGFSGGAIMADGSVGLILDIASLISSAHDSPLCDTTIASMEA